MLEISAWIVGVVATLVACACAAADGALLVSHVSETASVWDAEFADRERDHRALSMARVLAYVVAGASFAQALRLPLASPPIRVLAIAIAATLVCVVAEGMGPRHRRSRRRKPPCDSSRSRDSSASSSARR